MGQRDAFSSQDIQKVNKMYKCSGTNVNTDAIKPPMNSHNNINELIDESEETMEETTTARPNRPNRPDRPFLSLVGSLVNQVLSQG